MGTYKCRVCSKVFVHQSSCSRHQKQCGVLPGKPIRTFGKEDVAFVESRIDERYALAMRNVSDALDLLFFNKDRPWNQTLRKRVKKSDLMDIYLDTGWTHKPANEVNQALRTRFGFVPIKDTLFKDLVYAKTKRGPRTELSILVSYESDPVSGDPDDIFRFRKEVADTCDMYQKCNSREEFVRLADDIRDYIMDQANTHQVRNVTLRVAHEMYQEQLKKFSLSSGEY